MTDDRITDPDPAGRCEIHPTPRALLAEARHCLDQFDSQLVELGVWFLGETLWSEVTLSQGPSTWHSNAATAMERIYSLENCVVALAMRLDDLTRAIEAGTHHLWRVDG